MNILICDRFHSEVFARLKAKAQFRVETSTRSPEEAKLKNCDILIIRSGTQIDKHLLDKAPNLKLVISTTSGFNHIDIAECEKRNIKACYCPEANPQSAAELTMLLMLSAVRKFLNSQDLIRSGTWNRDLIVGSELHSKQLGIIGLGRIGKKVAHMAQSFGMQIKAHDPYLEEELPFVEMISFEELIRSSDIISLHIPYTKKTKRAFKRVQFDEMLDTAILINTSRGDILSEDEMLIALEEGAIAGAALDVFEREPLPTDSRLIQHPKIICTPHIGAATEEAYRRGSEIAFEKIIAFSSGKELDDLLPPKTLWYQDLS